MKPVDETMGLGDWVLTALGNHLGDEVPAQQRAAAVAAVLRGTNPAQAVKPVDAMVEGALAYVYFGKFHTQELVAVARSADRRTFYVLVCHAGAEAESALDHRVEVLETEAVERSAREVALSLRSLTSV